MRSVSERFLGAITTNHVLATEAVVLTTAGDEVAVPILSGGVTLDQTAAVRGRCDITLTDDGTLDFIPRTPADTLAPYGNEIRLSRGIRYPDGMSELVSLGVFRLQVVGVDDTPDGVQIRCTGLDRAQRVIDARFEEPYTIAVGTNYATAILTTVQAAWSDVEHDLTATTYTTPTLFAQEQDDRWAFVQEMATAIGMRLYFDGDGVLRMVPDALTDSVATIAEGGDGASLLSAGREWTREATYNRVVATGENTGEAIISRGVATDDNPLSPTYYFGPFGKVPRFYGSPFVTTDAQAASAAQAILNRELGTTESVNFGSFVLPHLEPGDTVRITRERIGVDEDHIVDSLTIPLGADGSMSGRTRARQIA